MIKRTVRAAMGILLLGGAALAQTSTSFRLEEVTFNAGGTPSTGVELTSPHFRITLASVGDTAAAVGLSAGSFSLDAGFDSAYPPPGEVAAECSESAGACLVFRDAVTLEWPPSPPAVRYNLYRDMNSAGFGDCEQPSLGAATATDHAVPTPSGCFYYLVTSENRLAEEGTKGFSRIGGTVVERSGNVCP